MRGGKLLETVKTDKESGEKERKARGEKKKKITKQGTRANKTNYSKVWGMRQQSLAASGLWGSGKGVVGGKSNEKKKGKDLARGRHYQLNGPGRQVAKKWGFRKTKK